MLLLWICALYVVLARHHSQRRLSLYARRRGQGLAEYGIIVIIIAISVSVMLELSGHTLTNMWDSILGLF